jgi:hypothetical protein
MDAVSKRGVDGSGKFHTTAGGALRLSAVRTAGNPHLQGDLHATGA